MKAYIIKTKALSGESKTSYDGIPAIMEVEGEQLKLWEDSSLLWAPEGLYKFRITKPESVYDPDGKPPVFYSHSIYLSKEEARKEAESMIKLSFERSFIKNGIEYTEQDVLEKYSLIKEIMLT